MVGATKVNGSIITWRGWVSTSGMTVESTQVSIRTTKSMALAFTRGQMEDATKGSGTRVSNMAWELMLCLKSKS